MPDVNVSDVQEVKTVKALDFTTVSKLVHNSLQFAIKIADLRGWTQVSNVLKLIDDFVSNPELLELIMTIADLVKDLTKEDVKNLVNVAKQAVK